MWRDSISVSNSTQKTEKKLERNPGKNTYPCSDGPPATAARGQPPPSPARRQWSPWHWQDPPGHVPVASPDHGIPRAEPRHGRAWKWPPVLGGDQRVSERTTLLHGSSKGNVGGEEGGRSRKKEGVREYGRYGLGYKGPRSGLSTPSAVRTAPIRQPPSMGSNQPFPAHQEGESPLSRVVTDRPTAQELSRERTQSATGSGHRPRSPRACGLKAR